MIIFGQKQKEGRRKRGGRHHYRLAAAPFFSVYVCYFCLFCFVHCHRGGNSARSAFGIFYDQRKATARRKTGNGICFKAFWFCGPLLLGHGDISRCIFYGVGYKDRRDNRNAFEA